MQSYLYDLFYELEDAHWWFAGMRKNRMAMIEGLLPGNPRTLEIACGTGGFLMDLRRAGHEVFGCDISGKAIGYCRERGLKNLAVADLNSLPYGGGSFDFVACNGGLYHESVRSEAAALEEMRRVCRRGGLLLVTDVAEKKLYGRHDRAFGGRTRYSLGEMVKLVSEAGFEVVRSNYADVALFPAAYVVKTMKNRFGFGSDFDIPRAGPLSNRLLKRLLYFEAGLIRRVRFPFGAEVMVVARKRG